MYSVHFRLWHQIHGETDAHEISKDLFDVRIDPLSITGVDYYQYESRQATFTLFEDSWLATNLSNGITASNQIGDLPYWKYAIVIKQNNVVIYTGYLRRDKLAYNRQYKTYEIALFDLWAIIRLHGEKETGLFDDGNYDFQWLLFETFQNCLPDYNGNNWDWEYFEDYNYETNMTVSDQLVFNGDAQAGGGWSSWYMYPGTLVHSVRSIQSIDGNTMNVYFMKYWQNKTVLNSTYVRTQTRLQWQKFTLTNNIQVVDYDQQNISDTQNFYPQGTQTAEELADDYLNQQVLFNTYWVTPEYPTTDTLNMYSQSGHWQINNNKVYYSGELSFETLSIIEDKYTYNGILNCCLLVNNLAMYIDRNGSVVVRNKNKEDDSYPPLTIDDENLFLKEEHGILKEDPDYDSIFRPLANFPVIAEAIKNYYLTLFATLNRELICGIEDNYDLNIDQKIRVDGRDYKIISLSHKLPNEFWYNVKMWSI